MNGNLPVCLLLAAAACAASDAFAPPVIGYVASESGTEVRPMVGTPGAGRVTGPVALPVGAERVAPAPGRTFAIGVIPDAESAVVLSALDSTPAASPIVAAMKSFDRAVFSASGKAAALYGQECACVQTIAGLPDAPVVKRTLDVTGRDITAVAVSDDASVLAVASTGELARYEGDSAATWSITASAVTLSPDATSLAAIDAERKTVSLLREGEWSAVTSEGDAAAIAFAGPNSIVVADAATGLAIIDTSTGERTTVECACLPTSVERTALDNTFRLTGMDAGAVWLLRLTEDGPRTVFVPVQKPDVQESEQ